MKIIDARNQTCPKPVIMTKKAIEASLDSLTVIVDNQIAKANVLKLCTKLGCNTDIEEKNNGIYINILRELDDVIEKKEENNKDICYVFGSDVLGKGSNELGKILIKGFIYTLTETKPYPKSLIFLNSAIRLTTEGSEVLEDLSILEQNGVNIVSCGTCLDYFKLKEKLIIGQISNMYDIVEIMSQSNNTIML